MTFQAKDILKLFEESKTSFKDAKPINIYDSVVRQGHNIGYAEFDDYPNQDKFWLVYLNKDGSYNKRFVSHPNFKGIEQQFKNLKDGKLDDLLDYTSK